MEREVPFAELTGTLIREVFEAVSASLEEQAGTYAELAGQAGLPLDAYLDRLLGGTPSERRTSALRHLQQSVLPALGLSPVAAPSPSLSLSAAGRQAFLERFRGVTARLRQGAQPGLLVTVRDVLPPGDGPADLDVEVVLAFALAELERDATLAHGKLRALLAAGLPRVRVDRGEISSKMVLTLDSPSPPPPPPPSPRTGRLSFPFPVALPFQPLPAGTAFSRAATPTIAATETPATATPPLRIRGRLVNERTPALERHQEIVASVRVEFRVDSFPDFTADAAAGESA